MVQWFLNGRSRATDVAAFVAVLVAASLTGCGGDKQGDKAKQAAAAAPPPTVVVTDAVQKSVPIYGEFVAQIDAKETVEIRARVQAFLEAQQLEVAMARLGKTETDERRLKPLAERRAVPQQDYDDAAANLLSAKAGVSAAKSQVEEAELNLSYCTIKSPIKGLIGKRLVAPGNLVGKGEATLLDTVSSIDPIRVNVTISEAEYLKYFGQQQKQSARTPSRSGLELVLADGSVYPYKGKFVIVDRAVDLKTGTLTVISEFPNPQGQLRPGQFGRVRTAVDLAENAILVPKRAVQEIQGMKSVLVVGADNMVALRTIRPGETVGDMLIILDGVKPGDRVIVDGVQKARPGSKVNPTTASASGAVDAKADGQADAAPSGSQPAAKAGQK